MPTFNLTSRSFPYVFELGTSPETMAVERKHKENVPLDFQAKNEIKVAWSRIIQKYERKELKTFE